VTKELGADPALALRAEPQERLVASRIDQGERDVNSVAHRVEAKIKALGLTLREAERVTGISKATLSRVVRGKEPTLATYLRLEAWVSDLPVKPNQGAEAFPSVDVRKPNGFETLGEADDDAPCANPYDPPEMGSYEYQPWSSSAGPIPAKSDAVAAALGWYAEQVADCRKIGKAGDPFRQALDRDGGERAIAALLLVNTPAKQGDK
jgi:transcriptional regulator with XRE-family HTH domain